MGFLTLGRRFLGVTHDIIDDRIDVVTRGCSGLTVACARCHDHKFDPIPTDDYYSLYGVFRSSREKLIPIGTIDANAPDAKVFEKRYAKELAAYEQLMAKHKRDAANRVRARVADYLLAQFELEKYPEEGFDVNILPDDMVPAICAALARLSTASESRTPSGREWFAATPKNREEIARRYGQRFAEIDAKWKKIGEAALRLDDDKEEAFRRVLYGPDSPCEVPDGMIGGHRMVLPDAGGGSVVEAAEGVDRALIESAAAPPQALVLIDAPEPVNGRVFRRGNPSTPGDEVPRHFLSLLKGQASSNMAAAGWNWRRRSRTRKIR